MAESERYLPTLITKLEDTIVEAGLRNTSIVMRMTGCPNGCARPWVAELACVGKAPGTYNLMLGGGYHGERLNKLYRYERLDSKILTEQSIHKRRRDFGHTSTHDQAVRS
jgi:sulfite reductase (NADPH) hemoprotein beta-component